MYKGLTTYCTALLVVLVQTSVNASEEVIASISAAPSAKIKVSNINTTTFEDTYLEARNVFFNESQIVDDITERANSGEVNAQHQLGDIYRKGNGVTKSDIVALMWYIVSEENGHKSASDSKEFTEQYMAFDQVSLAYKMANNWLAND